MNSKEGYLHSLDLATEWVKRRVGLKVFPEYQLDLDAILDAATQGLLWALILTGVFVILMATTIN